jgi:hypothetical protein
MTKVYHKMLNVLINRYGGSTTIDNGFLSFLFEKENNILEFQNSVNKNLDVDIDVIYQRAKFKLKIPYM